MQVGTGLLILCIHQEVKASGTAQAGSQGRGFPWWTVGRGLQCTAAPMCLAKWTYSSSSLVLTKLPFSKQSGGPESLSWRNCGLKIILIIRGSATRNNVKQQETMKPTLLLQVRALHHPHHEIKNYNDLVRTGILNHTALIKNIIKIYLSKNKKVFCTTELSK